MTIRMCARSGALFAAVAALLLFTPLGGTAQTSTTASVNGAVVDSGGEPVAGAAVQALHEPSGSRFSTTTRSDGRYNLRNLRVGGPYRIEVSFIGLRSEEEVDINLSLGQDLRLDFQLEDQAVELEGILVTGDRNAIFSAGRTGAGTNVSRDQIDALPSIARSLNDYTRMTPQLTGFGGGQAAAGRSNRYNNIQIDGVAFNDVFGLSSSGVPTLGEPVSLDAIEEFRVNVAPYDVREGGFTGASVNAVTRSGTNELEGSVYFFGRNESFVGRSPFETDDGIRPRVNDFNEWFFGARLGGPILQDRLFFFVNAEMKRTEQPQEVGPAGSGLANEFVLGADALNEIRDISLNQYGFDPGGFDRFVQDTQDDKLLARLDWNLSDQHRMTLRYNYVDGADQRGLSRSRTNFSLGSRLYDFEITQNSVVAQMNSSFSGNLVGQGKLAYTRVRQPTRPTGERFPAVIIDVDGNTSVNLGVEQFRQANVLEQDLWEVGYDLTHFRGNHAITFGGSAEYYDFYNLFIDYFDGFYRFDGIDAFRRGQPSEYEYKYSQLDDPMPAADWGYVNAALFVQDEWDATDALRLTLGLRAELPVFPDTPERNQLLEQEFGFRTDVSPSSSPVLSPRAGFNWDVSGDRSTQLRGGVGLFMGVTPGVWLSNQYSNDGVSLAQVQARPGDFAGGEFPEGFFEPDPRSQPRPDASDPSNPLRPIDRAQLNIVDPDFKLPQVLRSSLAIDQELPWGGLVGTLEGLYTWNLQDIFYENINLGPQSGSLALDGRPTYERFANQNFNEILLLTNSTRGYQGSLTTQLELPARDGLFGRLAYTFTRAEDENSGTSSRAISQWQNNYHDGRPNERVLGTSLYEIRHRIISALSYRTQLVNRFPTTFSLFYEGRSGLPFSFVFSNNVTNAGNINDLFYVPAGPDEVRVVDAQGNDNWAAFDRFVSHNPHLDERRGQVTIRNGARSPWINQLDLRVAQEIPSVNGQRLELTLDVLNAANIINSEWGQQEVSAFASQRVAAYRGVDDATGLPVLEFRGFPDDSVFQVNDLASRWQLQLGVRYSF